MSAQPYDAVGILIAAVKRAERAPRAALQLSPAEVEALSDVLIELAHARISIANVRLIITKVPP